MYPCDSGKEDDFSEQLKGKVTTPVSELSIRCNAHPSLDCRFLWLMVN